MRNNHYKKILGSILYISLAGCSLTVKPPATYTFVTEGLIDCFPSGLQDEDQKPVYCELSGVAAYDDRLVLVSDKSIPQRSPVFTIKQLEGRPLTGSIEYLDSPKIVSAKKYEDLTTTPNKKYIIATTAFDRHLEKKANWDVYNSFIYWPVGAPQKADIAVQSQREGVSSSINFRQGLSRVLGKSYFKVEGLTALPDQKLLMGIRELGESYKQFDYKVLILELDYSFNEKGQLLLGENVDVVMDFQPPVDSALQGLKVLGLSSLEYIPSTDEVLISTSWESGENMGGYIWKVDRGQLLTGSATPSLLKDKQGQALSFKNKVEGMAFINDKQLLLVHDDDRVLHKHLNRSAHQSGYSLIQLSNQE